MTDEAASGAGELVTGASHTLTELKTEMLRRAERGIARLGGIRAEDARRAG